MCLALEQQGVEVEVHHHEVAAPGQCEIGTKFNSLVKRADWLQILKYTVWNVAHSYGKTATFMPKPVVGDNGSGMHVHQSVWKGGQNLFAGNGYAGLSDFALYYIGGIIKHARALNAITNPGTNSYKRLGLRPAFTDYPFTLGVASGDPTPTGVMLWSRLAPKPLDPDGGMGGTRVTVSWELSNEEP